MSRTRIGVFCAALVGVLASSAVGATPMPASPSAQPGTLVAYTLKAGPTSQLFSRKSEADGSDTFRIPPALIGLAHEGHVQNISQTDDYISLLADKEGVRGLSTTGSSVSEALAPSGRLQPATGSITGIVKTTSGAGLGGATVTASLDNIVISTSSAPNGTYSLPVSLAGDYRVSVYAPGYEWQPSVLVAAPAISGNVSFAMVPQNLTIRGRVTNQANVPLSNVEVYASSLIWDNITAGDDTLTDASGNYTLTVSADTYDVRAFAPPLGTLSRRVTVGPSAANVNFGFKRPTLYSIQGIIRKSNGQPLPAGEITFYPVNVPFDSCDSWYSQAVTVGANGSYKVQLPAGVYNVDAQWPSEWSEHWVIDISSQINVAGNMDGYDVTLPAVGTIRGTVFGPDGHALPNATVFSWRNDPNASPYYDGFFQTDAAGNYVVTATLGVHNLVAFSSSYVSSNTPQVNLIGTVTGVNMTVRNAPIVAGGKVVGSDGMGLGTARIGYQSGPDNARYNRRATLYYNGLWKAAMDPGSYNLSVSQPYYHERDVSVNIAPGSAAIDFILPRKTYKVTGRVTTAVGLGVCDAYMTATDTNTSDSSNGGTTGDGYYAMMVAPGTLNVFPYKHDSNSSLFNTQISVPPVPAPVNFTLTQVGLDRGYSANGTFAGGLLDKLIGAQVSSLISR